MNFESFCTRELAKVSYNSMFIAIKNYRNDYQEISDFSIVFHVDYRAALARSYEIVEAFRPSFQHCEGKKFSIKDLDKARTELLNSYSITLSGRTNPFYTCAGVYEPVKDNVGRVIPGIKLFKREDVLELEGYRIHKRILRPGQYPITEHAPLTIAKNILRAMTPIDRWGQFRLSPGKFNTITVSGITITDQDIINEARPKAKFTC